MKADASLDISDGNGEMEALVVVVVDGLLAPVVETGGCSFRWGEVDVVEFLVVMVHVLRVALNGLNVTLYCLICDHIIDMSYFILSFSFALSLFHSHSLFLSLSLSFLFFPFISL